MKSSVVRAPRAALLGLLALAGCFGFGTPLATPATAMAQAATVPRDPNASIGCRDTGPRDYPIAGGWFYTEEARGCITGLGPDRFRGYLVVDDDQGAFWTEFRRYGGVDVLGYPLSQRYHFPASDVSGYWYQAFERGILQWRPESGRAELANVFEQFTEAGLDADLEALGIPPPQPTDPGASFASDAERRMSWLSEPRFLARYFFDPVAPHSSDPDRAGQTTFATQEQAWAFFGLPQSLPAQVGLRGPAPGRAPLYPLVHTFLAQRFQKGGLELFLEDPTSDAESFLPPSWSGNPQSLFDPTIVPGDGHKGCVTLTAVGLLARTVGVDKLIPSAAIQPIPLDPAPRPFVQSYVPPAPPGQLLVQMQLSGTGFRSGEPITIQLTDALTPLSTGSPTITLPPVTSHLSAANRDGSFDQILTARAGTYTMTVRGDTSGTSYSGILDLTVPSATYTSSSTPPGTASGACRDIGLPVAS